MFRQSFRQLVRPVATRSLIATPRFTFPALSNVRFLATGSTLTKEDVLARSISVLKTFDIKQNADTITPQTEFIKDLGMDSLDYNDALVALEEEFDVVFDDNTANEIKSVGQTVDYILKNYLPAQELLDKEIR
ncbi:unnamed protein product [Ambrosiozyma monospora]|uniref:Unnamed protein product n=1 Tax=Ambrosiozyma monospora TaxID=43982 RepID=A0ACB5SVV3_AMBMO|nr:unnamed protein product [Ambrosiozyma monospora]